MKKFRSTWLMALFVAAIAGYTAWEYRKAQSDAGLADDERLAFTLTPDVVNMVKIIRGGEVIELRKEDGAWKMVKPVADEGEGPSIDGFIYPLLSQRVRQFSSEEKAPTTPEKWAEYGLEPATVLIEVGDGKKTESISISSKNAFDGSFYIRQGDELLLGDMALAQLKERPSSAFRSKRMWRERGATLVSVRVENFDGKESFKLVKKEKDWAIEPAPPFAVDPVKLDEWVQRVQQFAPAEIAREGLGAQEKTEFLLAKPSYQVSIEFKRPDNQAGLWTITVGQDRAGDIFTYSTTRPTVYKTSAQALSEIRLPAAYFRDSSKAFAFPLEQARRVEVRSGQLNYGFVKKDSSWAIDGDAKGVELDEDRLIQLIQNTRTLEAGEFPASAGSGFADPQIKILNGEGKTLFALFIGDEYKANAPYNKGAPFRFVKTDQVPDVMGIAKEKLDRLLDPRLVKEKK